MSKNIDEAFVQQYSGNIQLLFQQKGSLIRPFVRQEPCKGKSMFVDMIGKTAAVKKTSRHADTPQVDTPHSRRRLTLETFQWGDLIDNADKVRMLKDPTSEYALAAAFAMGRSVDEIIVDALLGSAYTGENGSKEVSFDTSKHLVSANSTGMTLAKLRQTKKMMDSNDVPEDDRRILLYTANQLSDLLGDDKLTSGEYANVKALIDGQVNKFMGFRFVRVDGTRSDGKKIIKSTTANNVTTRQCVAFHGDAVCLGVGEDIVAKITERSDKSFATQVYFEMNLGSTRMQEDGVIRIDCVES